MSDKITRRDWFRLRGQHQNRMLAPTESGVNEFEVNESGVKQDVLSPVAPPVNHDGLDLSELPPMREAILEIQQINALFADIAQLGTDIQLMQRSVASLRATASRAKSVDDLAMAKDALLTGRTPRVQIRYRWQGVLWIDTLTHQPDGYRIVRIVHQV